MQSEYTDTGPTPLWHCGTDTVEASPARGATTAQHSAIPDRSIQAATPRHPALLSGSPRACATTLPCPPTLGTTKLLHRQHQLKQPGSTPPALHPTMLGAVQRWARRHGVASSPLTAVCPPAGRPQTLCTASGTAPACLHTRTGAPVGTRPRHTMHAGARKVPACHPPSLRGARAIPHPAPHACLRPALTSAATSCTHVPACHSAMCYLAQPPNATNSSHTQVQLFTTLRFTTHSQTNHGTQPARQHCPYPPQPTHCQHKPDPTNNLQTVPRGHATGGATTAPSALFHNWCRAGTKNYPLFVAPHPPKTTVGYIELLYLHCRTLSDLNRLRPHTVQRTERCAALWASGSPPEEQCTATDPPLPRHEQVHRSGTRHSRGGRPGPPTSAPPLCQHGS